MNDAGRIGFVIRGVYNAVNTYDFLDVVYYNGASYVAKKLTAGNEPGENNDYWQILVKRADADDYVTQTDYATTEKAGIVKPDGTTITVSEDGTISGSNQIVVDAEFNSESENPVQNKVISAALSEKADATQLDSTVEGSYAAGVAEEISGINADLTQLNIDSIAKMIHLNDERTATAFVTKNRCTLVLYNFAIQKEESNAFFLGDEVRPRYNLVFNVAVLGVGDGVLRINTSGYCELLSPDLSKYVSGSVFGTISYDLV